MRRDKTVVQIVLILSIVHGTLAAPAVVRQRYLDVTKDSVTAVSERRSSAEESSPLINDDMHSVTLSESSHSESEAPGRSSSAFELEAPQQQATNSDAHRFFNDDRKAKLKLYGGIGATVSIFAGILYGLDKLVGPGSEPTSSNPPNSSVVSRGAIMHPSIPKTTSVACSR